MAEQSRLEEIGFDKRQSTLGKTYSSLESQGAYSKLNPYDENHPDARSDGDEEGKGTGVAMTHAVANPNDFSVVNGIRSQKMNYSTLITKESGNTTVGGKTDRNTRNRLFTMNKYREGNEYGENSVDTSSNLLAGQFFVRS